MLISRLMFLTLLLLVVAFMLLVATIVLRFRLDETRPSKKKETYTLPSPKFAFIMGSLGRLHVLYKTSLNTRTSIPFLYEVYSVASFYPKMSSNYLLTACAFLSPSRTFPSLPLSTDTLPIFDTVVVAVHLNSRVIWRDWSHFISGNGNGFFAYDDRVYFVFSLLKEMAYLNYMLVYSENPFRFKECFLDPLSECIYNNIPNPNVIRDIVIMRDTENEGKSALDWYDSVCLTDNKNTKRTKKKSIRRIFGIEKEENYKPTCMI